MVLGQESTDPREIYKARLRGIGEDDKNAGKRHIIENVAARNRGNELREDILVSRLLLAHRFDVINGTKISQAQQARTEDHHDRGQSLVCIRDRRLAK